MSDYMTTVEASEIGKAMWTGLRLSSKSAGALTIPAFAFCTLPCLILPKLATEKLRLWWGGLVSFFLAILFQARFPYYRAFHSTFDLHCLMGWNDDRNAVFWTLVEEYGLIWRLLLAVLLTAVCWKILQYALNKLHVLSLPQFTSFVQQILVATVMLVAIAAFAVFVRFGGSFTYADGVSWLSAGVTNDEFLNECILDDIQALYRVREFAENMRAGKIDGVDASRIREFARSINGYNGESEELRPYLEWEAQGAILPRPRHIFIIIGESWAQWPMLEKYENLHVADGIKGLMAEPNSYSTRSFLPNGEGTAIGIVGIITGLSAVNMDAQYQPRSYDAPYITSMAPQLERLGYQVDFWYGGISSWDNMNRFTLAQGFHHFYGYPDYKAPRQNAWGTKDSYIFDALFRHLSEEPPTVHVIMTVTNHPPYDLDLEKEGFDFAKTRDAIAALDNIEDVEDLTTEMGHYWYMDKVVSDFVHKTMEEYPDSLFILTGDHAARTSPGTRPTVFEHQSVPFVLYGQGVQPQLLSPHAVGGHTSITATLIELIAPKGFHYYSLAESMTRNPQGAFSSSTWITDNTIGSLTGNRVETIPGGSAEDPQKARGKVDEILTKIRTLSWWLMEKGTSFE
ncbi:LTA synthase family protein [Anaerovibrio sp. RM50]|uniref:LTA synthase family protein n=1 Tax=Anaerovibrio sp. RM50 TaxID=1200557 RepID=UPI001E61843E|nr:LTA synthase family protein [Anaerovibrio sp. RM50]